MQWYMTVNHDLEIPQGCSYKGWVFLEKGACDLSEYIKTKLVRPLSCINLILVQ